MTSRRRFLKTASLSTAALAASPVLLAQPQPGSVPAAQGASAGAPAFNASGKPRRVIFLVADGMSAGVPSMTEHFARLVRPEAAAAAAERGTYLTHFWQLLNDRQSARGLIETHSLDSMVTDSAAGASAWGCGCRVLNNAVNMLPDGRDLQTIHALLHDAGVGTGLVTTTRITHATPAGFAANVPHRNEEAEIAPQYLDRVDVLMGGGTEHYDPKRRDDGRDLFGEHAEAGYAVVRDRDALLAAPTEGRLLGIFGSRGHLPYTIDQRNSPELIAAIPTLAEMTAHALETLAHNPNGFVLQVEGGRVDHAAHSTDGASLLWDQLAFDDAVGVALAFQQRHPDTLVVVTSDHANGNPGLNGMGRGYTDTNASFRRVLRAKGSTETIERRFRALGRDATPEEAKAILDEVTGLDISLADAGLVADAAARRPVPEINVLLRWMSGILGQVVGNHTGIHWTSGTHTEDFVLTGARGPWQDAFTGIHQNTEVFGVIMDAFGIAHRNTPMTAEEAAPYIADPFGLLLGTAPAGMGVGMGTGAAGARRTASIVPPSAAPRRDDWT